MAGKIISISEHDRLNADAAELLEALVTKLRSGDSPKVSAFVLLEVAEDGSHRIISRVTGDDISILKMIGLLSLEEDNWRHVYRQQAQCVDEEL